MLKKVFIIILNYNGGKDIIECLNSLRKERAKIVVIDNASSDNSCDEIKKLFPRIKIIKNKKNLGFSGGNNVGIRYALKEGADAVFLLNQDTIAQRDFLCHLLKNKADIVGPVIKFKRKGRTIYDYGGQVNWLLGRSKHQESHLYNKKKVFHKLDYISGCAILIRKSVFEKIGFLNESFFLYFEDVDFCLRAKKEGFKISVEPKAIIFHKLKEEKKKKLFQIYNLLRSNLIFVNIYVPFYRRPIAYLYLLGLLIKTIIVKFL